MKLRVTWMASIFVCLILQPVKAQSLSQTQFDSLVEYNSYTLTFNQDELNGNGRTWLLEEAKAAKFFLIGEKHGSSEIPLVTSLLYGEIAALGYDYAALEIGRVAANQVQELLKAGQDSITKYLAREKYAKGIAFLDWKEELEMVKSISSTSEVGYKSIIGLDHEFIYGMRMYLEMLKKYSLNDQQHSMIDSLFAQLNENEFLLGSSMESEFKQLKNQFKNNEKGMFVIENLEKANYIYGRFRNEITRIESNSYRENLMKLNFMEYLTDEEIAKSKILFKFGGFHSAPSVSSGLTTLGTFIEEWSIVHKEKAFNLYIDTISGNIKGSGQNAINGDGDNIEAESFFGKVKGVEADHPFKAILTDIKTPVLINLKKLRKLIDKLPPLNRRAISLINSFDAYLAIPNATPSHSILSQE